jgi:DNA-3-methyladenine glycosylase
LAVELKEPRLPRRLRRHDLPTDAVELARALIGKSLVHTLGSNSVGVRIVETEAYPVGDPAGWAYRGRTAYNAPLFQGFGRIHVYLSYGVSWLTNIVADAGGGGAGVLFRAGEPIWGIDKMVDRRGRTRLTELASGPGKLSAALAIDLRSNDHDFFNDGALWLGAAVRPTARVIASRRVGVSKAIDQPLRFYEAGSAFVSGPKSAIAKR